MKNKCCDEFTGKKAAGDCTCKCHMVNETKKEALAEQLHEWYLEACQDPESRFDFNPEVQVPFEELPEGSKFLDRYIAGKVLELLATERKNRCH